MLFIVLFIPIIFFQKIIETDTMAHDGYDDDQLNEAYQ